MDKKTKLYIGIGLLGVGAYLYFKSSKNMVGLVRACPAGMTMQNGRCVSNATFKMTPPPISMPKPSPTIPQPVVGNELI